MLFRDIRLIFGDFDEFIRKIGNFVAIFREIFAMCREFSRQFPAIPLAALTMVRSHKDVVFSHRRTEQGAKPLNKIDGALDWEIRRQVSGAEAQRWA